MKRPAHLIKRLILIVVGTAFYALGIDLAIHAGFGGATLAVLWMGVSAQLGITLGQASWLVAGFMLLFCLIYDRRQVHVGTILYQLLYGILIDLFARFLVYTESRVLNFALMVLGVVIMAFGAALYSLADLGRGTYEGVTFALVEKNSWPIWAVRTSLDAAVVVLGVLLGGQFGLCTVTTVLIAGFFIQTFTKLFKDRMGLEF